MRIAYVCADPGVPAFGTKGASIHVQAMLREHLRRGHEVHLVATRTGGPAPADLAAVQVHELPAVGPGDPGEREEAARRSDAAVAAVLTRLGPLDLVHERYSLWGRTATAWAAQAQVPSVLEVNAPLVAEQQAHRVLVDSDGAALVARSALTSATVVACVSAEVARWAASQGAPRPHVVPNGVDVERVDVADRPVADPAAAPFVVGFVGTMRPWHGVDLLVEAMALLPRDWHLLLVGDGPQAPQLLARAAELGLSLELTGAVGHAEVPRLLHRMDVAVAPYPALEDPYFSPLKVYEYLAAGLPVVASRVGQLPDLLADGRLGTLVPAGDVPALADALAALRADRTRREVLRRDGRATAVARHSWADVLDRLLALVPVRA